MIRTFLLTGSLILGSGCASLNSVSLTRVPEDRSRPVSAERWVWGILGIYFDNDHVDEAAEVLRAQCPNGRLSGVFTKTSTRLYPLWTTRSVSMTAYCLPEEGA